MHRRRSSSTAFASALVLALLASAAPAPALATKRCFGVAATIVGTSRSDSLAGTARRDVIVALGGNDTISGKGRGDLICAGGGKDTVYAGGGSDHVGGGTGDDVLVAGTKSDLLASSADVLDGGDGSDILIGGPRADLMRGGAGIDALLGVGGSDTYNGGGATDIAAFLAAVSPVTVDLAAGTASGEGADTLISTEAVMGSPGNDVLRGDDGTNYFWGMAGDDTMDGRDGRDFVFFSAEQGVVADLVLGWASGEGDDTLVSIENLVGTEHDDIFYGDSDRNYLDGGAGYDDIDGDGGDDVCVAEEISNCPQMLQPTEETAALSTSMTVDDQLRRLTTTRDAPTVAPPKAEITGTPSVTAAAGGTGYLRCFAGENGAQAYFPTGWYGQGRLYARARYAGSYNWSGWSLYPWMYFGDDNGTLRMWYWNGAQWVIYNGWAQFVSSQPGTVVEAWYWHETTGQWFNLSQCLVERSVSVGIVGLPIFMTYG